MCGLGRETALKAYENIISEDFHKVDLAVEIIENAIDNEELKKAVLKLIPDKKTL